MVGSNPEGRWLINRHLIRGGRGLRALERALAALGFIRSGDQSTMTTPAPPIGQADI